MGADGAWLVEYHRAAWVNEYNNGWESFAQTPLCMNRDYTLFALVAGIRGRYDEGPLFPRRGFPPNDGGQQRGIFTDGDVDTGATWLTTAEAIAVGEAYATESNGHRSVEWDAIVAMMTALEAAGLPARVLFACDQG